VEFETRSNIWSILSIILAGSVALFTGLARTEALRQNDSWTEDIKQQRDEGYLIVMCLACVKCFIEIMKFAMSEVPKLVAMSTDTSRCITLSGLETLQRQLQGCIDDLRRWDPDVELAGPFFKSQDEAIDGLRTEMSLMRKVVFKTRLHIHEIDGAFKQLQTTVDATGLDATSDINKYISWASVVTNRQSVTKEELSSYFRYAPVPPPSYREKLMKQLEPLAKNGR